MHGDYLKRASAEFVGTFALIFIGVGSLSAARTLTDVGLAYGLVIAVMVSAVGHISGGHFNPAITFGFFVTRRIAPVLAVVYWVTQFGAAILAALLLKWVLPAAAVSTIKLGVPTLGPSVGAGEGLVIEAVITFFLVWVFFATAVDPRGTFKAIAGLAIGFAITFGVLMAGALTGGIMNPARAVGPMLVQGSWNDFWIWIVGPCAGGAVAALLYDLLYLRPESLPVVGTPDSDVDEPGAGKAALS
jgi:aquaporin TIP